jgi:hypothetical protein
MYVEEMGVVKGATRRIFESVSTYRGSYEKLNGVWTWNLEIE